MKFVVTNLDKTLLLQTLYAHAVARGEGLIQQEQRMEWGENVAWLTHRECTKLLQGSKRDRPVFHVDFCDGRPLKLAFSNRKDRSVVIDSFAYDLLNGRYRFLEALLHVFDAEKIIIEEDFGEHLNLMNVIYQQRRDLASPEKVTGSAGYMLDYPGLFRSPEVIEKMEEIVLNLIPMGDDDNDVGFKDYWRIDTDKTGYTPGYVQRVEEMTASN